MKSPDDFFFVAFTYPGLEVGGGETLEATGLEAVLATGLELGKDIKRQ